MAESSVRVIRRRPEHDDEIFALYSEVFGADGGARFRARWPWQYLENPNNRDGDPVHWIAVEHGHVIGHMSTMPFQMWWGDRELRAVTCLDQFVRKDARGRGLGLALVDAYLAEIDLGEVGVDEREAEAAAARVLAHELIEARHCPQLAIAPPHLKRHRRHVADDVAVFDGDPVHGIAIAVVGILEVLPGPAGAEAGAAIGAEDLAVERENLVVVLGTAADHADTRLGHATITISRSAPLIMPLACSTTCGASRASSSRTAPPTSLRSRSTSCSCRFF